MHPLAGVRIVVTRAAHQAEELAAPLRALGADVVLLPAIAIAPPENPVPLRETAARCDQYDWIVFTSVNAVEAFVAELPQNYKCRTRVAAVGTATAQAADRCGLAVALTPEKYIAESLVEALANEDLKDRRILIPRAAVTRDVVPRELQKLGAQVDVVEAYRNILPPRTAIQAANVFREPFPDWVLFASSSAVSNIVALTGPEPLRHVSIGTIGPATSQTVLKAGLRVTVEAAVHSITGLVEAVVRHEEQQEQL